MKRSARVGNNRKNKKEMRRDMTIDELKQDDIYNKQGNVKEENDQLYQGQARHKEEDIKSQSSLLTNRTREGLMYPLDLSHNLMTSTNQLIFKH